jgi:hypothetical protein
MINSLLNLTEPLMETPLERTPPDCRLGGALGEGLGTCGKTGGSVFVVGENICISGDFYGWN